MNTSVEKGHRSQARASVRPLKLRELLARTASRLQRSPGLTDDDMHWLRRYALRLVLAADSYEEKRAA